MIMVDGYIWMCYCQGKKRKVTITRRPSVWSARDTVAYRNGYPVSLWLCIHGNVMVLPQ